VKRSRLRDEAEVRLSSHRYSPLEESIRRRWQVPEDLLRELGLKTGMVFMDIGCGDGFFTIPAAEITGNRGRVFAVDADASAISRLNCRVAEKGLSNVTARVGAAEETVFCKACADLVFYSIVLHDFGDPGKVLRNAKRMIKPTGKLVNLDWKKKSSEFGPPVRIRFSEEEARNLIEVAGFRVESVKDSGQDQYVVVAKP
jgi:ubiquinone/menaquinone biosynthesis C-methylase UbiE